MKEHNKFIVIPLAVYTLLYIPFLGNIPYLDGNIDFIQTYDFFTGGFPKYFHNWGSVHPPFNFILTDIAYIFGINPFIYTLIGLLEGLGGIIALYYLAKKLSSKRVANISTLLLATSPFFISIGIFALRDFLIIPLLLCSLHYYNEKKYVQYGLLAAAAVLTKETLILLPLSIILTEIITIRQQEKSKKYRKAIALILPILLFLGWIEFLNSNHKNVWHDWLFTTTANSGTIYTVMYNIVTGNFLNQYGFQQWLQLFILNFNWVYWILSILGLTIYGIKRYHNRKMLHKNTFNKTTLAIITFCTTYIIAVLTIQTYTIPRYILPIIPFLLLITANAMIWISDTVPKLKYVIIVIIATVVILSSFFSIDPISTKVWGTTTIFGEKLYDLKDNLSGNDGITYNMQYLLITKKRTQLLNNPIDIQPEDCSWLFPDPNNDKKTLAILKLKKTNNCLLPNTEN